jgi:hypothetical protein
VTGNIGDDITLSNNYARSDMLVNGSIVTGGTTTNKDGANVTAGTAANQYNNQAFWVTTLGWDFTTIWEWDTVRNLPKLRNVPGQ